MCAILPIPNNARKASLNCCRLTHATQVRSNCGIMCLISLIGLDNWRNSVHLPNVVLNKVAIQYGDISERLGYVIYAS